MHVIAIISQKGGSGKTTLATALAVAHEEAGGTAAVADLDPQGSSVAWHHFRSGAPPIVAAVHPPRLERTLRTFRALGVSLVVIDTAPHASAGALAASKLADLVLVPCRPSTPDLAAIGASLEVATLAAAPAVVVLNAVPPRGLLAAEAVDAVRGTGARVAPVTLGARIAHVHAFTLGRAAQEFEPRGKAAVEVEQLYRWAVTELHRRGETP